MHSYCGQNAAQKRRSKQKIMKIQQKHGVSEEGSLDSIPVAIHQSPITNGVRASDNPYNSASKDKALGRERARPRQGAPAPSGPMRRRLEGAERASDGGAGKDGNNPFIIPSENVSFANGFSHHQKLSK